MTRDHMQQLIETAQRVLVQNYRPQPLVLARGEGAWVWDVAGNRYLDLTAGIAACPLGHGHPKLAAAIAEQAKQLIHVSNLFYIEPQIRLAEELALRAAPSMGAVRSFFCNSGAEANEAALKLAKRYQTTVLGRPERTSVLSFEGSFHGRSIATVALTGQEKYRSGFGPLIEWARILPWPTTALDPVLQQITELTCAVIIEPIQAEGGIRIPPQGFLRALRDRCTATGTVLIFDEVQTGIGRLGAWFGHQHPEEGAAPDVMSLAKGLAGGVPIGAMVATDALAQGFAAGSHASTFGGNPLATAAGLCVLRTIAEERLLDHVTAMGEHLARGLARLATQHAARVRGVRGRGLLRGLALDGDATPVVQRCREGGVLLSVAGGTVVRFAPPLIVVQAELDQGIEALDAALGA
ncbi:MAG: aspartate aminotransferase family protein [Myxococcales bacterium]|nr:aspartate aminotransferase family protein [Myxococcales bacterium]